MVKDTPCAVGEDPSITRPQDVIQLTREVVRPIAMRLLDFYEFKSPTAKRKAFEAGFIVRMANQMHEFDWKRVAITMGVFDKMAKDSKKLVDP